MKLLVNRNSLIVGELYLRKMCIIEIKIIDNCKEYEGYIPFYESSGSNDGKIAGKWYPILGVYYYGHPVKKCIKYFVKLACGSKYNTIRDGWLMKSPFFVNFDGFIKDANKIPNGFGNHDFTDKLENISKIISELYKDNLYTIDNELRYQVNNIINNQKDIGCIVQYMVLGKIIDPEV